MLTIIVHGVHDSAFFKTWEEGGSPRDITAMIESKLKGKAVGPSLVFKYAKESFVCTSETVQASCIRIPFSGKLCHMSKSVSKARTTNHSKQDSSARRAIFDGFFASITKDGFQVVAPLRDEFEDSEEDTAHVEQIAPTQISVSAPGAWLLRIVKMPAWLRIASEVQSAESDEGSDTNSDFHLMCAQRWRDDSLEFPEGVLPLGKPLCLGAPESMPVQWPASGRVDLNKVLDDSPCARVWNLLSRAHGKLLTAVCKLVAAVLVCEEADTAKRRVCALGAQDALGQFIFQENDIKLLCSQDTEGKVARFRLFAAFMYVFQPNFNGGLQPQSKSNTKAGHCEAANMQRVLQLLHLTSGFDLLSIRPRKNLAKQVALAGESTPTAWGIVRESTYPDLLSRAKTLKTLILGKKLGKKKKRTHQDTLTLALLDALEPMLPEPLMPPTSPPPVSVPQAGVFEGRCVCVGWGGTVYSGGGAWRYHSACATSARAPRLPRPRAPSPLRKSMRPRSVCVPWPRGTRRYVCVIRLSRPRLYRVPPLPPRAPRRAFNRMRRAAHPLN